MPISGGFNMPRIRRMVVKGEDAVYHVMSRTALDGYVLGDIEKEAPALISGSTAFSLPSFNKTVATACRKLDS